MRRLLSPAPTQTLGFPYQHWLFTQSGINIDLQLLFCLLISQTKPVLLGFSTGQKIMLRNASHYDSSSFRTVLEG